ncbi:MAG: MarR family winged helix-turn-helix transcriptional regulator [Magnetospirillum sp. WYHS-4]
MTDTFPPSFPAETEESLRQAMELLFFAYRDFTAGPDAVLEDFGFGRAHHRVIYFVGRHPGITVGDLLGILRITKQSLGRVLGDLLDLGFVTQTPDARDRRRRRLILTPKGADLEQRLTAGQMRHVGEACRAAGPAAAEGFRCVLRRLVNPEDRARFPATP